jgi:ureidoacrylate peracid hydrolase
MDALLIIDMQNSFLHPRGGSYAVMGTPLVHIDRTITAVCGLADHASRVGVPVLFTRHCYRVGYADAGRMTVLGRMTGGEVLLAGTWDAEIIDELRAFGGITVDKARMDAFYNTGLELILRGLHATSIGICGVITNACVETTVRSAAMRDFDVTVFSDCCTTTSDEDQAAALHALERYGFAHIRSSRDGVLR